MISIKSEQLATENCSKSSTFFLFYAHVYEPICIFWRGGGGGGGGGGGVGVICAVLIVTSII